MSKFIILTVLGLSSQRSAISGLDLFFPVASIVTQQGGNLMLDYISSIATIENDDFSTFTDFMCVITYYEIKSCIPW